MPPAVGGMRGQAAPGQSAPGETPLTGALARSAGRAVAGSRASPGGRASRGVPEGRHPVATIVGCGRRKGDPLAVTETHSTRSGS